MGTFKRLRYFWITVVICGIASADARPRIAIIGGGSAGLISAWLIESQYDVTLIEKASELGGHVRTVQFNTPGGLRRMDAGMDFFTRAEYPHFSRLLELLQVPVSKFPLTTAFFDPQARREFVLTPMERGEVKWFSFWHAANYSLHRLRNFYETLSGFVEADPVVNHAAHNLTVEGYLDGLDLNRRFKDEILYPILQTHWPVPRAEFRSYGAKQILSALHIDRTFNALPEALAVQGGTESYVRALAKSLDYVTEVWTGITISHLTETEDGHYRIQTQEGDDVLFEGLIIAVPLTQIPAVLQELPRYGGFSNALAKVQSTTVRVVFHGDPSFMPRDPEKWSEINIKSRDQGAASSTTYYRKPAGLDEYPVFRTWVLPGEAEPQHIYFETSFAQPKQDQAFFEAQKWIEKFQGWENVFFVGAHTQENLRHESAVDSAISVARRLLSVGYDERLNELHQVR